MRKRDEPKKGGGKLDELRVARERQAQEREERRKAAEAEEAAARRAKKKNP